MLLGQSRTHLMGWAFSLTSYTTNTGKHMFVIMDTDNTLKALSLVRFCFNVNTLCLRYIESGSVPV